MTANAGPIAALSHVNLRASAAMVERLRRFYCDVIGLEEGPRPPFRSRGHWLYGGGRDLMHLTVAEEAADASPRDSGWFDHYAFAACDVTATRARLDAAGVAYEVDEVPARGEVQLFLTDPAGVGVELNFATAQVTAIGA